MTEDRLTFVKTLKDGRVLAVNTWRTGYDELVFANQDAFEQAKEALEVKGELPKVVGYTSV